MVMLYSIFSYSMLLECFTTKEKSFAYLHVVSKSSLPDSVTFIF